MPDDPDDTGTRVRRIVARSRDPKRPPQDMRGPFDKRSYTDVRRPDASCRRTVRHPVPSALSSIAHRHVSVT